MFTLCVICNSFQVNINKYCIYSSLIPFLFSRPPFLACTSAGHTGLGYCTLVVITMITIYYMVIIAWIIFYFVASFQPELGWGSCLNDFNTDGKYLLPKPICVCDLSSAITMKRFCVSEYTVLFRPTINTLESIAVCGFASFLV